MLLEVAAHSREAALSPSAHSSHTRALPEHEREREREKRGLNAQDKHGHAWEGSGGVFPSFSSPLSALGPISFIPFCDEEARREGRNGKGEGPPGREKERLSIL